MKKNKILYGKNPNEFGVKFKTLKAILSQAKIHRTETNAAAEKYLNGTWHWVVKEAKNEYHGFPSFDKLQNKKNTEEDQIDMTFLNSNQLVMSYSNMGTMNGN